MSLRITRWTTSTVAALALTGGAIACIEALDLAKMVERTDAAIFGTITNVRTTLHAVSDDDRRIYTLVTVKGTDLYTGDARTLEAAFLGGTYQGETMNVTCMPAPGDYRVGNDVVIFSAPVEGWGPDVERCVYAAMGGIFRTVETRHGTVVLGKGQDTAIETNVTMTDLQPRIVFELRAKEARR